MSTRLQTAEVAIRHVAYTAHVRLNAPVRVNSRRRRAKQVGDEFAKRDVSAARDNVTRRVGPHQGQHVTTDGGVKLVGFRFEFLPVGGQHPVERMTSQGEAVVGVEAVLDFGAGVGGEAAEV